jgi:nanoRNase/pAp phosphatase (c-di-AMP/oligoRNAs hydrolase)
MDYPKAKRFLASLKRKKVLITFHSLGDLDAVCSALALSWHLGKKAVVAAPDRLTSEARKYVALCEGTVLNFASVELRGFDCVVVDSSSPYLLSHLEGKKIAAIFDHHAINEGSVKAANAFIDANASSSSEIIAQLISKPDRKVAEALLVGLIADSARFKNSNARTLEVAGKLLSASGKSMWEVSTFASHDEDISERIETLASCKRLHVARAGNLLVAVTKVRSFAAHVADALVSLGADVAIVGEAGKEARVSARCSDRVPPEFSLVPLMEEAGKMIGGVGGGHRHAATATGSNVSALDGALSVCMKVAEEKLSKGAQIKEIEW